MKDTAGSLVALPALTRAMVKLAFYQRWSPLLLSWGDSPCCDSTRHFRRSRPARSPVSGRSSGS